MFHAPQVPGPTGPAGVGPAGASIFDATVGSSGADFTTVKGAVDAAKKNILIISSVTETASIDPPVGTTKLSVTINQAVTWAFSTFVFSNTNPCDVFISGQGTLSWAHTTANLKLFNLLTTDTISISGITLDNNSTQAGTAFSTGIEKINNVRMELPNLNKCGFAQSAVYSFYNQITFVGGGSSCAQGLITFSDGSAIVSNNVLTGTFKAQTNPPTGTAADNMMTLAGSTVSNLEIDMTGTGNISFLTCGVSNLKYGDNATSLVIESFGNNAITNINGADSIPVLVFAGGKDEMSNLNLGTNGLLDVQNTTLNSFVNVSVLGTGNIDLTDTSANNNYFENCRVVSAITVAGDRNKLVNCDLVGGVTVSSGADDNGFVNCQAGADAGGGALTITVAAGSNRTRIVGCMTDAAISDAGTGTVTSGNSVY